MKQTAEDIRQGKYNKNEYAKEYNTLWKTQNKMRGKQTTLAINRDINFNDIKIKRVISDKDASTWKFLLDNYHYIPHSSKSVKSYGRFLRYFAIEKGIYLALIAFSGSFLSIGDRDEYIGWNKEQRLKNNRCIAQNIVFCILPTTHTPNLASAILSRAEKKIKTDWKEVYSDKLVLIDTLVAEDVFSGTCYKASNWICVGKTKGVGFKAYRKKKKGYGSKNIGKVTFKHNIKKLIFIKPLCHNWRKILCEGGLKRESPDFQSGEVGAVPALRINNKLKLCYKEMII